ncbi:aldose epimerase family protein [Larkinella rosea]|uniref:aldose epimerase family protein n=1 Tax=Larkinella rosea TaxID=2025312 RepID=UPI001E48572F|nr:aldose epimerase family protein [Larkinella rosea]
MNNSVGQLVRRSVFIGISVLFLTAFTEKPTLRRFQKVAFGQTADGKTAHLFTLTNAHGMVVKVTNFGGIITSIQVPDKNNQPGDVVLGFDSLSSYLSGQPYLGALLGRYGSFIGNGRFSIDNKDYQLATNAGTNHLHGGKSGFDKKLWQAEEIRSGKKEAALRLAYMSANGEEGFPGNLDCRVTYTLTDQNELRIDYEARTDQKTHVNLTHHTYFDLSAGKNPTILSHEVQINADRYVVMDPKMVPTGELREVKNSALDFTKPAALGSRMEQLPGAYDHNFLLNRSGNNALQLAATVFEPGSGRYLSVFTTEPGLELATANWLNGKLKGKGNRVYAKQSGFLLYPQHLPDSPNQSAFPGTLLKPGEVYRQTTVYQFSVKTAR